MICRDPFDTYPIGLETHIRLNEDPSLLLPFHFVGRRESTLAQMTGRGKCGQRGARTLWGRNPTRLPPGKLSFFLSRVLLALAFILRFLCLHPLPSLCTGLSTFVSPNSPTFRTFACWFQPERARVRSALPRDDKQKTWQPLVHSGDWCISIT